MAAYDSCIVQTSRCVDWDSVAVGGADPGPSAILGRGAGGS